MDHPIDRRQFTTAAAAAVLGVSAMTRAEERTTSTSDQGFVDAHSHIWTPDVEAYPLAEGVTTKDLEPRSFTDDELVKLARPFGVTRVVLIAHSKFYAWDNRYLTDAAAERPETFRVVAMVDDRKPNPGAAMRALLKKHTTGFRITSSVHGKERWLKGPGMNEMWRTAADTRQAICCLANPDELPEIDAMCSRFLETPVVIDHLARIGMAGEIDDAGVKNLCRLARHEHVFVKVSAFYALGKKRPPHDELVPLVRRVFEAFGPERLMWGSDSPYQIDGPNTYASSLTFVRETLDFLTPADREWLLRGTASKVFFPA